MLTKIKMQVAPDLSKRVQEIVFKNGGNWYITDDKNIKFIDLPHLFIDRQKQLTYGNDEEYFNNHRYKEVSAYDFIASQGEQEWLPKYGEEALFSRDKQTWKKFNFLRYYVNSLYPFRTTNSSSYKYCKPLPKKVSFIQFLKDNDAYDKYMENIKIENQRWYSKEEYLTLQEIEMLNGFL